MTSGTRAWLIAVVLAGCSPDERVFDDSRDAGGSPPNGGATTGGEEHTGGEPQTGEGPASGDAALTGPGASNDTSSTAEQGDSEPDETDTASAGTSPGASGSTAGDGSDTAGQGSDTGASPGSSGTSEPAPCVPDGDERCFNGADDDCNGAADCADAACSPGASCEPSGDNEGVLIAADQECPRGYTEQSLEVYRGLVGGECEGCSCTPTNTQCVSGDLYFYDTVEECVDDMSLTRGFLVQPITYECPAEALRDGDTYGYRVGEIQVGLGTGTCSAGGTATPGPVTWERSFKYCSADSVGVGCQFGHVCVPKQTVGPACYESSSGECPTEFAAEKLFEGYEDKRTCGECRCDGAGDCSGVGIQLGSDWSCEVPNPVTYAGQKDCETVPYSPAAFLVGVPTDPVCSPLADSSGRLDPTERHVYCCEQ